MILVDYNNIATAGIMMQLQLNDDMKLEEGLIRHMVLVFILSYKKKYPLYGEVVLCSDGGSPWRKDFYPYYKANRKRDVDVESTFDYKEFYRILNLIRDEIKERMPYKVIQLNRVEGDDGIAVLAKHKPGPHVIISNDKDFGQLQRYPDVIQYSPLRDKDRTPRSGEIRIANPLAYLKEQIIRGDGIDGVPNILSDDDAIINKEKRQKSVFAKKMPDYMEKDLSYHFSKENIERNIKMIDFESIPQEYVDAILAEYESQMSKHIKRQDIFNYFVGKRLVKLMDDIQNF